MDDTSDAFRNPGQLIRRQELLDEADRLQKEIDALKVLIQTLVSTGV